MINKEIICGNFVISKFYTITRSHSDYCNIKPVHYATKNNTLYKKQEKIKNSDLLIYHSIRSDSTKTIEPINPPTLCTDSIIILAIDSNCQAILPDYARIIKNSDNNKWKNVFQSIVPGSEIQGFKALTMVAIDTSNTSFSCTFIINTLDKAPLVLDGSKIPNIISYDENCEAILPNLLPFVKIINKCPDGIKINQFPKQGTEFKDSINVKLIATDQQNNIAEVVISIYAKDLIAPKLICPTSYINLYTDQNCESFVPELRELITYTDNCTDQIILTQVPPTGAIFVEHTKVKIFGMDLSGLSDQCEIDLYEIDTIKPSVQCPNDAFVSVNDQCLGVLPEFINLAKAVDNCEVMKIVQDYPKGYIFSGSLELTIIAFDVTGNVGFCTFHVYGIDQSAPEIYCNNVSTQIFPTEDCSGVLPDLVGNISTLDHCDYNPKIIQSPAPGSIINSSSLVTFTAIDRSNNQKSCQVMINVVDTIPPKINCPKNHDILADYNNNYIVPNYNSIQLTDNCNIINEITQNIAAGSEFSKNTLITITAYDQSGNVSICSFELIKTPASKCMGKIAPEISPLNPNITRLE